PFVEGLVPVAGLGGDYFEHDEVGMRLVGRKSGRAFALGDPLRVRIENVSVARRRIDLALASAGVREAAGLDAAPRPARRGRERGKHKTDRRRESGRKKPRGGKRGR